eukprot:snap_masked-scaffold_12-processed-gene-10.20-mRNA-1 protein AED:1.00 eAED:1.00 QI:0/-1/0/0/-1/1/1/0/63
MSGMQQAMTGFARFFNNYNTRYIQTGSAAPVFHVMGGVFGLGVLMHARAHSARHNDPTYVPEH